MGKVLVVFLVLSAILAGAGMYYLQVYAYYQDVEPTGVSDVELTALTTGQPEPILYDDFAAIDSDSSPLRYRACFQTTMSQALLTETYALYDDPVPNNAPGWFDCFKAQDVGEALESGGALAFMGTFNISYGFDRVVAIDGEGRGFVWHQLNACGKAAFDGDPLPEGCPPKPD